MKWVIEAWPELGLMSNSKEQNVKKKKIIKNSFSRYARQNKIIEKKIDTRKVRGTYPKLKTKLSDGCVCVSDSGQYLKREPKQLKKLLKMPSKNAVQNKEITIAFSLICLRHKLAFSFPPRLCRIC